jgi:Fission yeast centromere protein N-terminal domain
MPPTPSTLATVISPPAKRARKGTRHGITDAERKALRQYYADAPEGAKPTQQAMRTWFSAKYHPISQSTVSDCLHSNYVYLETQTKPLQSDRLNRRVGKWPTLEAALYEWQLAINRPNHTVTDALL